MIFDLFQYCKRSKIMILDQIFSDLPHLCLGLYERNFDWPNPSLTDTEMETDPIKRNTKRDSLSWEVFHDKTVFVHVVRLSPFQPFSRVSFWASSTALSLSIFLLFVNLSHYDKKVEHLIRGLPFMTSALDRERCHGNAYKVRDFAWILKYKLATDVDMKGGILNFCGLPLWKLPKA